MAFLRRKLLQTRGENTFQAAVLELISRMQRDIRLTRDRLSPPSQASRLQQLAETGESEARPKGVCVRRRRRSKTTTCTTSSSSRMQSSLCVANQASSFLLSSALHSQLSSVYLSLLSSLLPLLSLRSNACKTPAVCTPS